jgi:hypothetical protein
MGGRADCLQAIAILGVCSQAWAWGATGHEWATGIAIEKLPDDIPAFVRDPAVLPEMTLMGRKVDRSKRAGWRRHRRKDTSGRTARHDEPQTRCRQISQ